MKRLVIIVLVLVLALVTLTACTQEPTPTPTPTPTQTPTPTPELITLKFYSFLPPEHPQGILIVNDWVEYIEEQAGGRVKFEIYPAQQLFKATDTIEAMQAGLADVAIFASGYIAGKVPLWTSLDLPFADVNYAEQGEILLDPELQTILTTDIEKYDLVTVGMSCGGYSYIWNTKKPVENMEDLKGLNIRAAGGPTTKAFELLGAAVTSMPTMDLPMALERGTVDGCHLAASGIVGYKLDETIKYGTIVNFGAMKGGKIMNKKSWDSLPKDIQDIILDADRILIPQQAATLAESDETTIQSLQDKGIEIFFMPADEQARWAEKVMPIWGEWEEANGANGKRIREILWRGR